MMRVPDQHTLLPPELDRIVQTRKIPNAFLFTGNPGTGKAHCAFEFAKAVNCLGGDGKKACLNCISCKKIESGMHPDMVHVHLLDKKRDISISQIREMEQLTVVRPNEARFRMVLISDAPKMTVQAQNALLKLLEEPPDHTFFILTSPGLSGLVATIISRCRQIRFKSAGSREMARQLADTYPVAPQKALIAARTAGADMQRALSLLNLSTFPETKEKPDWQKRRTWILEQLTNLFLSGFGNGRYLFLSEKLSREPELIQEWLCIIRSFFRDLCVFSLDPEKIANLDFSERLTDIGQTMEKETGMKMMDVFFETEQRLGSNSSIRLTLDRFFIKLSVIYNGQGPS